MPAAQATAHGLAADPRTDVRPLVRREEVDMTTLAILGITAAVLAALALAWWGAGQWRPSGGAGGRRGLPRLSTMAWEPQAMRVLDRHHRRAYECLRAAVPDFMVLAQIPLARFLTVARRRSYLAWLDKVGQECAHFVVCTPQADVLVVIELATGNSRRSAQHRRERVEKVLRQAGIPVLIWDAAALPPAEEVGPMLRTLALAREPEAPAAVPARA